MSRLYAPVQGEDYEGDYLQEFSNPIFKTKQEAINYAENNLMKGRCYYWTIYEFELED
jgi:hypothetical protein